VPSSAVGTVTPDGQLARLTGSLGPITAETYGPNAPGGIKFRLAGDITGTVRPGDQVSMSWLISVNFEGGLVSWGLSGNAFVPGAGTQFVSQNGQLTPGARTVTFAATRQFVGNGTGNGSYSLEFSLLWAGFAPGQRLSVNVTRMDTAIPAAAPTALLGLAGATFGMRRRRR
jgi:hypothetical protein